MDSGGITGGGSSASSGKSKKRKNTGSQRNKKKQSGDYPSNAARDEVLLVVKRYMEKTDIMRLTSKYTRHGYEGFMAFQAYMEKKMRQAMDHPDFSEDRQKFKFDTWVTDRAKDATWNLRQVIETVVPRPKDDNAPEAVKLLYTKVDWWQRLSKAFAKCRNRVFPWVRDGAAALALEGRQLLTISTNAEVIPLDEVDDTKKKPKEGGYGVVRRVRIGGDRNIPSDWELAGKTPKAATDELRRNQHYGEALAVRFPHFGIIKYIAIHHTNYEGYTRWWNGGSIRETLNNDGKWGYHMDNRELILRAKAEEMEEVNRLIRFRRHRSKLAWALLNIMDHVHKNHVMHNDISPDNILLHYPDNSEDVYIGVCDWGLATSTTEAKTSLYVFASQQQMTEELRRRYWVAPEIAHVHNTRESQVDGLPYSRVQTIASETFAIGKIAYRINYDNTADSDLFNDQSTGQVWSQSLKKLYEPMVTERFTLSHIIRRFQANPFNWTEPTECYRKE